MIRAAFVILALAVCGPAWAQVGSTNVPSELPADIKDWAEYPSCHRLPPCELTLANAVVEYDLYVDPNVQGIYAVSHYRVRPTKATGFFKNLRDYHGLEVVVWFPQPGTRPGGPPRPPVRVFIKRDGRWQEASYGSSEWAVEAGASGRLWRIRADTLDDPDIEKTLAATTF